MSSRHLTFIVVLFWCFLRPANAATPVENADEIAKILVSKADFDEQQSQIKKIFSASKQVGRLNELMRIVVVRKFNNVSIIWSAMR